MSAVASMVVARFMAASLLAGAGLGSVGAHGDLNLPRPGLLTLVQPDGEDAGVVRCVNPAGIERARQGEGPLELAVPPLAVVNHTFVLSLAQGGILLPGEGQD